MTRNEFQILLKGMKAVYTDPKFIPDQTAWEIWYRLLCDLDYRVANIALERYMQTSSYPPKPADIRSHAAQITNPEINDISPEEAFCYIRNAAQDGSYHSKENFAKLPLLIQKTIGSSENLSEIARMDPEEFETVEKSHFIRSYIAICEREKNDAKVSEKVRTAITEIKKQREALEEAGGKEPERIEASEDPEPEEPGHGPSEAQMELIRATIRKLGA